MPVSTYWQFMALWMALALIAFTLLRVVRHIVRVRQDRVIDRRMEALRQSRDAKDGMP